MIDFPAPDPHHGADIDDEADRTVRELHALEREEDSLRRTLQAHRGFLDAIDWTAMTRTDRERANRHGGALAWHLRCVEQAIDQRLFDLIHASEA